MKASQKAMERIYNAMRERRLSISQMCEKVGISDTTFWRYKSGETPVPFDKLLEMGAVVGMDAEEISKDPTPPPPSTPNEAPEQQPGKRAKEKAA